MFTMKHAYEHKVPRAQRVRKHDERDGPQGTLQRRGEEDERARSPDAEAAHKRSSNRAAARWAARENESAEEDDAAEGED